MWIVSCVNSMECKLSCVLTVCFPCPCSVVCCLRDRLCLLTESFRLCRAVLCVDSVLVCAVFPVVFDSGRCSVPHGHQFGTAPSRGRQRAELIPIHFKYWSHLGSLQFLTLCVHTHADTVHVPLSPSSPSHCVFVCICVCVCVCVCPFEWVGE